MCGVHCNTSDGPSKARSCESYYICVPGLLLVRPLWQCISSAPAHDIVAKMLKNSISGCEQIPLSLLGFAQSTSMNPLCIQCHPSPGQGCNFTVTLERLVLGTAGLCYTLSGRDRCLYRVAWVSKHWLLVCQAYGWRWLKLFVAFPCSSSALVISVSDLFCLPGKTRYF